MPQLRRWERVLLVALTRADLERGKRGRLFRTEPLVSAHDLNRFFHA
jgi:hypothetical protein